jgi:hypothetical protein
MSDALAVRRHLWGLSNGIVVLACAGLFWFLMAGWGGRLLVASRPGEWIPVMLVLALIFGMLIAGASRLRRRAGFDLAALRASAHLADAQRQMRAFGRINAAEGVANVLAVSWAVYVHRAELVWPLIGFFVGIHFIPLATVFRVPAYRVLGALASLAAISAFFVVPPAHLVVLGVGTGLAEWGTAVYLLNSADRLSAAVASVSSDGG